MPKTEDLVRVQHMLDAAGKAITFTADIQREDEKLALSVVRLLEIVGEAANNLSDEFQEEYHHIPWAPDWCDKKSPHSRLLRCGYGRGMENR